MVRDQLAAGDLARGSRIADRRSWPTGALCGALDGRTGPARLTVPDRIAAAQNGAQRVGGAGSCASADRAQCPPPSAAVRRRQVVRDCTRSRL
jgi:hypothetical protein